ncbi:hypothetical protein ABW21_db0204247 [Orbilia brochopaga]|nr:hypothetical protein ABW21_db0204247 [Drechslerella brochopaga]
MTRLTPRKSTPLESRSVVMSTQISPARKESITLIRAVSDRLECSTAIRFGVGKSYRISACSACARGIVCRNIRHGVFSEVVNSWRSAMSLPRSEAVYVRVWRMVGSELSFMPAIKRISLRGLVESSTEGWEEMRFVASVSDVDGIVADQKEKDKAGDFRCATIEVVCERKSSSRRTSASSRMIWETLETGNRSGQSWMACRRRSGVATIISDLTTIPLAEVLLCSRGAAPLADSSSLEYSLSSSSPSSLSDSSSLESWSLEVSFVFLRSLGINDFFIPTTRIPVPRSSFRNSFTIWSASSLVGDRTMTRMPFS